MSRRSLSRRSVNVNDQSPALHSFCTRATSVGRTEIACESSSCGTTGLSGARRPVDSTCSEVAISSSSTSLRQMVGLGADHGIGEVCYPVGIAGDPMPEVGIGGGRVLCLAEVGVIELLADQKKTLQCMEDK